MEILIARNLLFDWEPKKPLDQFVTQVYLDQQLTRYGGIFEFKIHPKINTLSEELPSEVTVDRLKYDSTVQRNVHILEKPIIEVTYTIELEPQTILYPRLPAILSSPRKSENICVARPFFSYAAEVVYDSEGNPTSIKSRAEKKKHSLKLFTPEQPDPEIGEKSHESIKQLVQYLTDLEGLVRNIRIITPNI